MAFLARLRSFARDDRQTDDAAAQESDEHGRDDRQAQVQAHGPGQLDVAHAHASRIGEEGDEQEEKAAGARDQVLRQVGAVDQQGGHQAPDRHRVNDPVGQQPVVVVDAGQGDQAGHEGQLEHEPRVEAAHGHYRGEGERGDQLDQRIARRDARTAMPAAPAEQSATIHRQVV